MSGSAKSKVKVDAFRYKSKLTGAATNEKLRGVNAQESPLERRCLLLGRSW